MIMEEIKDQHGRLLAMILRAYRPDQDGVKFHTPVETQLQLATIKWSAGHKIPAHLHQTQRREIFNTPEVLIIKRGSLWAHIYDTRQQLVGSVSIEAGDILMQLVGGHSFDVLEDVEFLEVKQGPYNPKIDKIPFKTLDPLDNVL